MSGRTVSLLVLLCASLGSAIGAHAGESAVEALVGRAAVRGGVGVILGSKDTALAVRLAEKGGFVVHCLCPSGEARDAMRRDIQPRSLYGKVSADVWAGGELPYTGNLVSLLVADGAPSLLERGLTAREMLRVLRPLGVALVGQSGSGAGQGAWAEKLKAEIGQDGIEDVRIVREAGLWVTFTKPWPPGIDEWTHGLHGADGNPVAEDTVVGPPRHLQWVCGPRWSKHHEKFPPTIATLVSAKGRVFYVEDETPPAFFGVKGEWLLTARDAFSGALLWRRPIPEWFLDTWPGGLGGWAGGPADYHRRLVAVGDRLFVTLGQEAAVTALDAATGKTMRTYCDGEGFTEFVCDGGVLYVASRPDRRSPCRIAAFDAGTGQQRWASPGGHGIAVSGGRVFFIAERQVGALDAATGRELWRASPLDGLDPGKHARRGRLSLQGPLRAGAGVVLVSASGRGSVVALSADSGKRLWDYVNRARASWFRPVNAHLIGGLVWVTGPGEDKDDVLRNTMAYGLDPRTGAVKKAVPCGAVWNVGHHQRCYPSKATGRYLLYSRRGAEFLDLETGEVALNNWVRGVCTFGVMPANGLLYAPPHACRCYSETMLRGLHALAPASARAPAARPATPRLERGPAYGKVGGRRPSGAGGQEWPTYRHDGMRSGATSTALAADLKPVWQAQLGGRLSAPTVAGGRIYVAAINAHRLIALSAETGGRLWEFIAGGRVDTPPTIWRDLALFGCADGWVYCLRAEDGQLAWRFRAAPVERRVGADGQLESAWPVHGSVLVRDSIAYFAAGRSSFLDGGLYVFGVDALTGEARFAHHLDGPWTDMGMSKENPNRGFVMPGSLPDVLASDGERLYMRHMAFDPELKTATDMLPNFYEAPRRSGEEFGGDHKYWCDLLEGGLASMRKRPDLFYRSYFNRFPGQRLYSTTGLLDDSWHIRSYWAYGQVVGQYIVFDGRRGYAVQAYPNAARWLAYKAGDGYTLYAGKTALPKQGQKLYALKPEERLWTTTLPLRPKAMVLAGDKLFIAGPPDPADPAEALAALEGQRGAVLWVVSAANGEKLAAHQLASPPVFDGLAVAGGRLVLSARDGSVQCLGAGR